MPKVAGYSNSISRYSGTHLANVCARPFLDFLMRTPLQFFWDIKVILWEIKHQSTTTYQTLTYFLRSPFENTHFQKTQFKVCIGFSLHCFFVQTWTNWSYSIIIQRGFHPWFHNNYPMMCSLNRFVSRTGI